MSRKPQSAAAYRNQQAELVRATCLHVATKLGDLMDEILIIGGLVPSLIINQDSLPAGVTQHVGTIDLDLGLQLALLNEGRYRTLTERLRDAGFEMDKNSADNLTRQRWVIQGPGSAAVDFLIPPSLDTDRGGMLRSIEADFAAVIAPGLRCAFRDPERVTLTGETLFGEKATRDVWACGAGGFLVLKALAFDGRGENKDAYDLHYVLRSYGAGPKDVAARFAPLLDDEEARAALKTIQRDFTDPDGLGAKRVAKFETGRIDEEVQADVAGLVRTFLRAIKAP